MESKAQFINKYSDDYEMISEIPRREVREDFSNPSLNEDKESESENMEHMVKSKRKSWKGEYWGEVGMIKYLRSRELHVGPFS